MSATCACCGALLTGRYYTIPGNDACYCQTCIKTRPRCESCGVPLGSHHWKLHDGRLLCPQCHSTAIYDPAIALAVFQETVDGLVSHLGMRLNVGVAFRLVDAPTLHNLRQQSHRLPPGYSPGQDIRTLGLYVRNGHIRVIYMLYGLPRLTFRMTVAHEYAHAWQGEQCPLLENEVLREGFAEWVAFYHLLWLGATRAARRMLESFHPYRPALEHMFDLERKFGRAGLIDYLKRAE
ncbi:MAG: protein DA1 [Chloroflexaceae bacterium]|nr:protein DA1 [Chloroflexaceae bacterium]